MTHIHHMSPDELLDEIANTHFDGEYLSDDPDAVQYMADLRKEYRFQTSIGDALVKVVKMYRRVQELDSKAYDIHLDASPQDIEHRLFGDRFWRKARKIEYKANQLDGGWNGPGWNLYLALENDL